MISTLLPIVEGQSETHAIGVLLRRLMPHLDLPHADIARPFRVKRSKVVRFGELERSIVQAIASRAGVSAVMVLLDADRDCPAELGTNLLGRAAGATTLPVSVVIAKIEIEAWVLPMWNRFAGSDESRSTPPAQTTRSQCVMPREHCPTAWRVRADM